MHALYFRRATCVNVMAKQRSVLTPRTTYMFTAESTDLCIPMCTYHHVQEALTGCHCIAESLRKSRK